MERNLVFFFSGTGNSLHAAKTVAASLPGGEVLPMTAPYRFEGAYDRIGFVYPSYGAGMPMLVERFIQGADFTGCTARYLFALATNGGMAGNAVADLDALLSAKGLRLSYGRGIRMFANYVAMYQMAGDAEERAASADLAILSAARDIAACKTDRKFRRNPLFTLFHRRFTRGLMDKDKGYTVSDACVSCGLCASLCPVANIEMKDGRPAFQHRCEQCVACVQWCPKQAINVADKTQARGRYHHPAVKAGELKRKA